MSDDSKVCYAVSSGSYSDYGVHAVFSTREKAEAFIALLRERDARQWYDVEIEEMPFNAAPAKGTGAYMVIINEAGEVTYTSPWYWQEDPDERPTITSQYGYGREFRAFKGHGSTVEHARRSAEELRRVTLTEPPALRK